jgi:hypothetical protein
MIIAKTLVLRLAALSEEFKNFSEVQNGGQLSIAQFGFSDEDLKIVNQSFQDISYTVKKEYLRKKSHEAKYSTEAAIKLETPINEDN